MRILLPYLRLYKRHRFMLSIGILLTIITLLANISLLTLSSWFLVTSAISGGMGICHFNYILLAVSVRIVAITRIIGRYFERIISHDATFRILQHLRVFIFGKILPLSPTELSHFRHGELLNCIVADVDTLDKLYLRVISPTISVFIITILVTLGLSFLNLELATILGSLMLLILILLPFIFLNIGKSVGESLIKLHGEYRQHFTNWLQSQAELIIFDASERYRIKMNSIELNWQKLQYHQFKLTMLVQILVQLIGGLAAVSILWMSSYSVGGHVKSDELIVLFLFCTLAAFETLPSATNAFYYLRQVIVSASRITQIVRQKSKIYFVDQVTTVPPYVSLQLTKVSFIYDNQYHNVLNNISINIEAGVHVAVLGHTGCGKSTLLRLITRTFDPQVGSIFINKKPLVNFSETTLRKIMSVIPQRVHLFSATLRDNLLLAAPEAKDEKLCNVLERVGLSKLLKGNGLNNWLGDGGRQISGGELRRLAIARAILHNAPLMLFDEPTNGLDAITEMQILNLLIELIKDKTVLMVTHRLNGLTNFDQIIIMNNGQIIEQGSYTELLAQQGQFYQLNKAFCKSIHHYEKLG